MHFSDDQLENIRNEYQSIFVTYLELILDYSTHSYSNLQAKEYAIHGFSRRLMTMARCAYNIFETLPPDRVDLPTREELSDAVINIQGFVISAFGSVDNLARIWVLERGLVKNDGSPIPDTWIGLRKQNECVLGSFSEPFQAYLDGCDLWFEYLANFRHALAHRIPLYIPPYSVPQNRRAAYDNLSARIADALNRPDSAEHERLEAEQKKLVTFIPWMTHSFVDESKLVFFHPQLLSDFITIEELARKMLEELDRWSGTGETVGAPS